MSSESSFLFYNAGAGSGKTYTLSKTYIKRLFESNHPRPFQNLLGITFTNKAVAEMKDRILKSLWYFSDDSLPKDGTKDQLLSDLCSDLDISEQAIRKRSKQLLQEILHNYSSFELTTIDTFTHRIIRSFAIDLDLNPGFEVTLEPEQYLKEAIEQLIETVEEGTLIQQSLLELIKDQLDSGKSWDISAALLSFSKLLLKEGNTALFNTYPIYQKDLSAVKKELKRRKNSLSEALKNDALHLLNQIAADESNYKKTLRDHLKVISEGKFNETKIYGDTVMKGLSEKSITLKGKSVDQGVLELVESTYPHLYKGLFELKRIDTIYHQAGKYALLIEISELYQKVLKEEKLVPIAEFNTMISGAIAQEPAPYIYERLGERYHGYFIDEFQDTSTLQWNNLKPLLSLAADGIYQTEAGGLVFIVGDAKQAIYRWRGGDVQQFLRIAQKQEHPFSTTANVQHLATNYRSGGTIISFNNQLFGHISTTLALPQHRELYQNTSAQGILDQKVGTGFVSIRWNLDEDPLAGLVQDIEQCIDRGYSYRDMAILVSTHSEASKVIAVLSSATPSIPFVSADVLKLGNNASVRALISLMRFAIDPKEGDAAYEIVDYLEQNRFDRHTTLRTVLSGLKQGNTSNLYEYLEIKGLSLKALTLEGAFHFCSVCSDVLGMTKKDTAYIAAFLDHLYSLQLKSISTLAEVLEQAEHIQKQSLQLPDGLNAVKILTIHKSKGLEFEVVFYPFVAPRIRKLNTAEAWLPTADLLSIEQMLLPLNKEMAQTSPEAELIYETELAQTHLDEINLLYVALTRAEQCLFIYTEPYNPESKSLKFSNLFTESLTANYPEFSSSEVYFSIGDLPYKSARGLDITNIEKKISFEPYKTRSKDFVRAVLQRSTTEQQELGVAFHKLMQHIESGQDLERIASNPPWELTAKHLDWCLNRAHTLISDPRVSTYFSAGLEVKNETVLLDENGEALIPDRLIFIENTCVIIDYKTGQKKSEHRKQLDRYQQAIESLYKSERPLVFEKIIVYLRTETERVELDIY